MAESGVCSVHELEFVNMVCLEEECEEGRLCP